MRKCNLSYPTKALQNSLISYNIPSFPYSLDVKILVINGGLVIDVAEILALVFSFKKSHTWDLLPLTTLIKKLNMCTQENNKEMISGLNRMKGAYSTIYLITK